MGKYTDDHARPFVEQNRRFLSTCIYCGHDANTREHIPSRVFLDIPYPEDEYIIVPACFKCNNGFSADEAYVSCFIDMLRNALSGNSIPLRKKTDSTLNHDKLLMKKLKEEISTSNGKYLLIIKTKCLNGC